jgi:hypothetical protein
MTHEQTELLSEARIFALASPILLPILEKRRKVAFECLIRDHKAGKTDTTALVAQLAVLWDLEHDLKSKEAMYNSMMEKQR